VEALIRDDPAVLAMWREAVTPQNVNQHTAPRDNITRQDGRGTAKAYTLARLKREAPTRFADLRAGTGSATPSCNRTGPAPYGVQS
jgi:hypothetical protein